LNKLQNKDYVIEELKQTIKPEKKPVCVKRKVAISADNKCKEKRRQNEEQFMQEKMKKIEKKIQEARERKLKQRSKVVVKTQTLRNPGRTVSALEFDIQSEAKIDMQRPLSKINIEKARNSPKKEISKTQEQAHFIKESSRDEAENSVSYVQNLDTDCQSQLIFPEKDGTFAYQAVPKPSFNVDTGQEDELDKLMREYNDSKKNGMGTPMRKEAANKERMNEDKRKSLINTMNPTMAPLFPTSTTDINLNARVGKGTVQYTSNIANIVNSTRAINSAYFQRCNENKCLPKADFTSLNFNENFSRSNKSPLDFFH